MVIRPNGPRWLVLRQQDHAHLSADLARAMALPPFDALGQREELIAAIAHHDDGWAEWDAHPIADPSLNRPRAFNEMDRRDALPIWRDSIEQSATFGPLAGATVAAHFLYLSRLGHDDTLTRNWVQWAETYHNECLNQWLAESPDHTPDAAQSAVAWLRFFDAFSLNLCRGPDLKPFPLRKTDGSEIDTRWLSQTEGVIEPWPFDAGSLTLTLSGVAFPPSQPAERPITWTLSPAGAE